MKTETRTARNARLAAFGARVRRARDRAGITQVEFAAEVGLHSNVFARIERGDLTNMSLTTQLAIEFVMLKLKAKSAKAKTRRSAK